MNEEPIEVEFSVIENKEETTKSSLSEMMKDILEMDAKSLEGREKELFPLAVAEIMNIRSISSGTSSLSIEEMKDTLNELTSLQTFTTDQQAFMEKLGSSLMRRTIKELMKFGIDVPDIASKLGYEILAIGRQKSGDDPVDIDILNKVINMLKELKCNA